MGSSWSAWDAQSDPRLQRVNDALRPVVARTGMDAVNTMTPLMEVCEAEEGCSSEDMDAELWAARAAGLKAAVQEVFKDGFHPGVAMRRMYALAMVIDPESVAMMSRADVASMFGETRAAFDARMLSMFEGTGVRSRDQKRSGAVEKMRDAQSGNSNRSNGRKRKQILGDD